MSDNGKQFDNPKFRDFFAELELKNYYCNIPKCTLVVFGLV